MGHKREMGLNFCLSLFVCYFFPVVFHCSVSTNASFEFYKVTGFSLVSVFVLSASEPWRASKRLRFYGASRCRLLHMQFDGKHGFCWSSFLLLLLSGFRTT